MVSGGRHRERVLMLDVSQFLTEIRGNNPRLAFMLDKMVTAINQTAKATGVDSTSFQSAPHPPQSISVKAANGTAHVTITDASKRSRALCYFVEHSTDPNFLAPHVAYLGAARGVFLNLPGFDDSGAAQPWYFRAYSMYPGSTKASAHALFGSAGVATPVSVGGATQLTPLTSTGAGTASTSGQQSGGGFGTSQYSRPEPAGVLST